MSVPTLSAVIFSSSAVSRACKIPRYSRSQLAAIALILDEDEEICVRRRQWVHNAWKTREEEGEFATLYKHLIDDELKIFEYFRMSKHCFDILLSKLSEKLRKQDTHWTKVIPPRERLAVCLRFLATGDSFKTISFSFRLGHTTVHEIVNETCKAIVETLMEEMLPRPTTDIWLTIANDFYTNWDFPNCLGALDGKHVTIQAPANSGSMFFNYKKNFSIVLLALVDARYNFIAVSVGSYGKNIDGGIFANSSLSKALERDTLSVPTVHHYHALIHKLTM